MLKKPQLVQVDAYASVTDEIKRIAYTVDKEQKAELLSYLISSKNYKQLLIFCRTEAGAEGACQGFWRWGLKSESIHSDKTHGARGRRWKPKRGRSRVLVAADLAARGIDVDNLPHVSSSRCAAHPNKLHPPYRTDGRATEGKAITLLS